MFQCEALLNYSSVTFDILYCTEVGKVLVVLSALALNSQHVHPVLLYHTVVGVTLSRAV